MTLICACGCGEIPAPGRRFVHGHHRARPLKERVFSRLLIEPSGCLVWTGSLRPDGYGEVGSRDRRTLRVHRLMYEWFVGPIPDGFHIDHLCRNRACAAPAHLEAVTCQVNVLRGISPAAREASSGYCKRGHEFDLLNTYWPARGGRQCRACRRAAERARQGRNKAEA